MRAASRQGRTSPSTHIHQSNLAPEGDRTSLVEPATTRQLGTRCCRQRPRRRSSPPASCGARAPCGTLPNCVHDRWISRPNSRPFLAPHRSSAVRWPRAFWSPLSQQVRESSIDTRRQPAFRGLSQRCGLFEFPDRPICRDIDIAVSYLG